MQATVIALSYMDILRCPTPNSHGVCAALQQFRRQLAVASKGPNCPSRQTHRAAPTRHPCSRQEAKTIADLVGPETKITNTVLIPAKEGLRLHHCKRERRRRRVARAPWMARVFRNDEQNVQASGDHGPGMGRGHPRALRINDWFRRMPSVSRAPPGSPSRPAGRCA